MKRKIAIGLMALGIFAGITVSAAFGYNLFCGT